MAHLSLRGARVAALFLVALLALLPGVAAEEKDLFCEGPVPEESCKIYKYEDGKCKIKVVPNCCPNDICEANEEYLEDFGICPADCRPKEIKVEILTPAEGETFYLDEFAVLKVTVVADSVPVIGAEVKASGFPDGSEVILYNDGDHGDGTNLDNVYGGFYNVKPDTKAGEYDVVFNVQFRKLDQNVSVPFVVDPRIFIEHELEDHYILGDDIVLGGRAMKKLEPTPVEVKITVKAGGKTIHTETVAADKDGEFRASYRIPTNAATGEWSASFEGADDLGNRIDFTKKFDVEEAKTFTKLDIEWLGDREPTVQRGDTFTVAVLVTDEDGKPVPGADVKAVSPTGEAFSLKDEGKGNYAATFEVPFGFAGGRQSFDVSAVAEVGGRRQEGKIKVFVRVEETALGIDILEPKSVHFRVGEEVRVRVQVLYPDGKKVDEAEVTASLNGTEFALRAVETGVYEGSHRLKETDTGQLNLAVEARDAQGNGGNAATGIEVTGESLVYTLEKNALPLAVIIVVVLAVAGYGLLQFRGKLRRDGLAKRRIELRNLIEEVQRQYYDEGVLPKDEFTRLFEKYQAELDRVKQDLGVGG